MKQSSGSHNQPPPRRSACAEASYKAEQARLNSMSAEERIKLALGLMQTARVLAPSSLPIK